LALSGLRAVSARRSRFSSGGPDGKHELRAQRESRGRAASMSGADGGSLDECGYRLNQRGAHGSSYAGGWATRGRGDRRAL